ncbi:MAG: HU family DNA-binding protein [Bacteroidales bacterium]|nr:HU family DNA-binding protein [Bacteroidales bacterium]
MNKSDLVNSISEYSGLNKEDSLKALEACFKSIEEALFSNQRVIIKGFGSFSVFDKAEKVGVNPITRQKIIIPAKRTIKFRPGYNFNFEENK